MALNPALHLWFRYLIPTPCAFRNVRKYICSLITLLWNKILFINSITQTRSGMAISFIDNCWHRRYGPRFYGPRDTEREDRKIIIVVSSRILTAKQLNCLDITIFSSSEGHLPLRLNNPSLTPVLATEVGRTDLNLWRPNNPSGEKGIQNNLSRTGKRYYSSFLSVITPDLQ